MRIGHGGSAQRFSIKAARARLNDYLHSNKAVTPSNAPAGRREQRWSISFYNARKGINSDKSYEHARARDGMLCHFDCEENQHLTDRAEGYFALTIVRFDNR